MLARLTPGLIFVCFLLFAMSGCFNNGGGSSHTDATEIQEAWDIGGELLSKYPDSRESALLLFEGAI